jgi:hypothetical protein
MRNLLLGAVLLATAACGAYAFPGERPSPTPATGTVSGTVVSVPCAPVEQAGQQCAGRPVSGLELDFACGQSTVTKAITDSKGYYSVQLQPGSCAVKFKTYMRYISGPQMLTIRAGDNIVANYVFDNGIRVPQPQQ